jgi:Ser/Thr protein kinase RdoA (MazF antagonist)
VSRPLTEAEAEAVSAVLGAPVAAGEVVDERHHVVRVTAADGRRAIVKRPRAPGDSIWGGEPHGLAVEWAALDVLAGLDPPVAPRLLGGDEEAGVVVLEDLGTPGSLADALLGDDPDRARSDLAAVAAALGRMHAATLGLADAIAAARARRGLARRATGWWPARLAEARAWCRDEAAALGLAPGPLDAELDRVAEVTSGAYVGLVHGDPCPDNTLLAPGGPRLIDFERAGAASVALDAGYLLAPFPSCWCFGRLPADVLAEARAAHEGALAAAGVALGEPWALALAAALALWAVTRVRDYADPDRPVDGAWGTTTGRPRLASWTAAFLAAPGADAFPTVAAAVAGWRARLGLDGAEVPGYPALARVTLPPAGGAAG